MESSPTLLFHDYETWGVNPKLDFPVQFAALRTNAALEVIGEPINFFCQIPNDYLPNPEASLITGITPQASLAKGMLETQFAEKVYQTMMIPQTCVVGYNNINFDDEVTRHLFYRNFLPVYEREYAHENSRWDIIDLVRAAYVLRPTSLNWCFTIDDVPSFKLEKLAEVNAIEHTNAHDALSDVHATISLAKKIKSHAPDLYEYYFSLRHKAEVARQIDVSQLTPALYISGRISPAQGCATWILPVCPHPNDKNSVIAIDLSKPLEPIFDIPVDALLTHQYSRDKSQDKPGLLNIKLNKCPFITSAKMLTPQHAERIGLDRNKCLDNYHKIKQHLHLVDKIKKAYHYNQVPVSDTDNVDVMLYERPFPSPEDKRNMQQIRNAEVPTYSELKTLFDDVLYHRQLFKFIGRNYPANFDEKGLQRWQEYRRERLSQGDGCNSLTVFISSIESLAATHSHHPKKVEILKKLYEYAQSI
ncbi:MAG: exodeoxyribonuclease I [Pseudomonadota bacterium]